MIRLARTTMARTRSFKGASVIDWPERGLVLVAGKNQVTGGSSGSGKSTVMMATMHPLGCCPVPGSHLTNWATSDEPAECSVTLVDGQRREEVVRGADYVVKGVTTGATATKKWLADAFGLTPEQLGILSYRRQGAQSYFLGLSDADKKEFLADLVPDVRRMEAVEAEAEARIPQLAASEECADTEAAVATAQVVAKRAEIPRAVARADQVRQALAENGEKVKFTIARRDDAARELESAEARIQPLAAVEAKARATASKISGLTTAAHPSVVAAEKRLTEVASLASAVKEELDRDRRRLSLLSETNARRRASYDGQLRDMRRKLGEMRVMLEAGEPTAEKALNDAERDLSAANKKTCPTCKQPWHAPDLLALEGAVASARGRLDELDELSRAADELDREITEFDPFVDDPEIEALRKKVSDMEMSVTDISASAVAAAKEARARAEAELVRRRESAQASARKAYGDLRAAEIARDSVKSALAQAAWEAESLSSNIAQLETSLNAALEQVSEVEKEVLDLERRAEDAQQAAVEATAALAMEKDLRDLVGRNGFLGVVFDEVLAEIAAAANSIIGRIPNTFHVVMGFRSETVDARGQAKRRIVTTASVDGHSHLPMESALSGGMATSVHLAVDLAIGEVLVRRGARVPGWLFLDEPFTGLGAVEKEAFIEVLREIAQHRLVVVVDHGTEESFDQVIRVVHADGESTIER